MASKTDKTDEVLFNLHDVYEVEVEPLVEKLLEVCKKYGFPFVCGVCYGQDENGSLIATAGYEVRSRDPLIFNIFSRLVDRPDVTKLLSVALVRLFAKKALLPKVLKPGDKDARSESKK